MSATCVSKFRSFWSFPTKQHRGSFYGTPCITDSQKLPKLNIHTEYCALSWYFRCVVPNHWKIHSCSDSQYAINSNAARPITGSEQWSNANDVSLLHVIYLVYSRQLKRAFRRPFLTIFGKCEPQNIVGHFVDPKRHILRVWLKTDGTTGQDRASLLQLAAISSPWWQDGADDGTAIIANWWKCSYRYDGTDKNSSIHCLIIQRTPRLYYVYAVFL